MRSSSSNLSWADPSCLFIACLIDHDEQDDADNHGDVKPDDVLSLKNAHQKDTCICEDQADNEMAKASEM